MVLVSLAKSHFVLKFLQAVSLNSLGWHVVLLVRDSKRIPKGLDAVTAGLLECALCLHPT